MLGVGFVATRGIVEYLQRVEARRLERISGGPWA